VLEGIDVIPVSLVVASRVAKKGSLEKQEAGSEERVKKNVAEE
jgi:hypothetical protein